MTKTPVLRALMFVLALPAMARADLPASRTVTYSIYRTPGDPESGVAWTLDLHVTAKEVSDDVVSWVVDNVTLARIGDTGQPEASWTRPDPFVVTDDGLWHVPHANPSEPTNDEFLTPPLIMDTLASMDPMIADMTVEWEGQTPLQNPTLATITFNLTPVGGQEPDDEGEDEPVNTGGGTDGGG